MQPVLVVLFQVRPVCLLSVQLWKKNFAPERKTDVEYEVFDPEHNINCLTNAQLAQLI